MRPTTSGLAAAFASAFAVAMCCPADAARLNVPMLHSTRGIDAAHSWISPKAKAAKSLLYVADGGQATVDIFQVANGQTTLVGTLTGFSDPQGISTDVAGNLYVVDDYVPEEGPVGGQLDVFPKGATTPSRIIDGGKWAPDDVAVDKSGNIYIANFWPVGKFSPGSVTVFGASGDNPIRTLRGSALQQVYGVTIDRRTSDAYVTYTSSLGGPGKIALFRHGRGSPTDLGVSFGPPWGITQDAGGNLLVCDGNGPIDIYTKTGGSLGTINVPGAPLFEAFNTDRSLLYVSNFNNHDVEIFSYPAGTMVGSITKSQWSVGNWPTGVAYWPPAR